jgi:hypothetical protein
MILELERRGITRPFARIHEEVDLFEPRNRPPIILVDLEADPHPAAPGRQSVILR